MLNEVRRLRTDPVLVSQGRGLRRVYVAYFFQFSSVPINGGEDGGVNYCTPGGFAASWAGRVRSASWRVRWVCVVLSCFA